MGQENDAEKSSEDLSIQQTLDQLRNFKPKRPVLPSSQFPDLSVEGETIARMKVMDRVIIGGCHFATSFSLKKCAIKTRKLNELCRGICVVIQTTMLTDSRLLAISTATFNVGHPSPLNSPTLWSTT